MDSKQEFKDFSINHQTLLEQFDEKEIEQILAKNKIPNQNLKPKDEPTGNAFVDSAFELSNRTTTEKLAAAFKSTGDARADFFSQVMEQTSDQDVYRLLEASWNDYPLDTLRLIAQLRDITTGKSIRCQYYACIYWLYQKHPRTLLHNISILIDYGYWKDLYQFLIIFMFKGHIPEYIQKEHNCSSRGLLHIQTFKAANNKKMLKLWQHVLPESDLNKLIFQKYRLELAEEEEKNLLKKFDIESKLADVALESKESGDSQQEKTRKTCGTSKEKKKMRDRSWKEIDRKLLEKLRLRYARECYAQDAKYRYFHIKFAEIIAKELIKDAERLASGKRNISLASKWAPSLNGHVDRYTLLATSISLQIAQMTRNSCPEAVELFTKPIPIAVYLARKLYHKQYLVKLRSTLQLPERYMCAGQFSSLPYRRVASKCMQKNRSIFIKHDKERFENFIHSNKKVSGKTLKPNELVNRGLQILAMKDGDEKRIETELLERQWNSYREHVLQQGFSKFFKSAVSICDVSGSMCGIPLNAAIGLTLITMSLTDKPWNQICITFHSNPSIFRVDPEWDLLEKIKQISQMDWGANTDLTRTFKLVIEIGQKNKLKDDQMPKFLFIYSDMQFDEATNSSETNFEEAKRLFSEAGYSMPKVVFWNLRAGKQAIPVEKNESGTLLLAGFSANQLAVIMQAQDLDSLSPIKFIEDILSNKRYDQLVVVD